MNNSDNFLSNYQVEKTNSKKPYDWSYYYFNLLMKAHLVIYFCCHRSCKHFFLFSLTVLYVFQIKGLCRETAAVLH